MLLHGTPAVSTRARTLIHGPPVRVSAIIVGECLEGADGVVYVKRYRLQTPG